ncbi:MAG: UDP-N-acetylmuramate dehydrogenase [Myxococcota bacterium]|nr:UDP-N-acetylmuramate dehydrogenase [Myxococcota bacterium]
MRDTAAELVLAARAEKLDIEQNVPLAPLTTFRIGGNAAALIATRSPDEMARAVRLAVSAGVPWTVLGGGSNLLAPDAGFPGLVVLASAGRIRIEGCDVEAEAGAPTHRLAVSAAWAGVAGLGFAAGIPGTIGGAVVGNAGAWGRAMGDVVISARVVRAGSLETVELGRSALAFDYRSSALQAAGDVVLSVRFALEMGDRLVLLREIDEIVAKRAARLPLLPSAGSFFRNLPPAHPGEPRRSAGKLLDEAGSKGLRVGDAAVWDGHANTIVNLGHARCHDVLALAAEMERRVYERFGERLEREVRVLGAPPNR